VSTINRLLIALHFHGQSYRGHLVVLISLTFIAEFRIQPLGRDRYSYFHLSCWRIAVFLVNSRSMRLYAGITYIPLIVVALLRHFAEFLKDGYVLTLVFSTSSLVSDWYSSLIIDIS